MDAKEALTYVAGALMAIVTIAAFYGFVVDVAAALAH